MKFRGIAFGVALAFLGLGLAVGIGLASNAISGDTVGLSAQPLRAGDTWRRPRPRTRLPPVAEPRPSEPASVRPGGGPKILRAPLRLHRRRVRHPRTIAPDTESGQLGERRLGQRAGR